MSPARTFILIALAASFCVLSGFILGLTVRPAATTGDLAGLQAATPPKTAMIYPRLVRTVPIRDGAAKLD